VLRDADELLAHSYRVGYVRGVATALAGRAFVFAHRGRPEDAARCVAEAREVYGAAAAADRHIFTVVEIADAAAALAAGDPGRARGLAAAAVATPTTLPCLGLALLGEAQVAAGDPAGALGTARRLAGLGPDAPWPAACGSWIEGLARAALGERAAALACLRRGADRLDGLGLPFQTARAWLGWAEVAAAGRAGDDQVPAAGADAVEAARRSLAAFDGSAPARSPTGPAGCYAAWASGRPLRPGRRPASCRSGSCRWSGWSPSGSATPRSPGGCSSAPGPSPPTCSMSMAGSGSGRARR
jgi:tetratricopeptide (TPR) repeat protein